MAWTSFHSASIVLVGFILLGVLSRIAPAAEPITIEVFTTTDRPVVNPAPAPREDVDVNIVEVDTLERLNAALSEGLSSNPLVAKATVQNRLSTAPREEMARLQRAAKGLAMATQLGVDRTPAMVFNQHAVIYGVTDLNDALRRYRAWRETSH